MAVTTARTDSVPAAIAELSRVRLTEAVASDDLSLSAGMIGTVVYGYAAGDAYEVEFTGPVRGVVTVLRGQLVLHQDGA